jgi:hypothetical protein
MGHGRASAEDETCAEKEDESCAALHDASEPRDIPSIVGRDAAVGK